MPSVRSNENAAARWIKSLFNNTHPLCQLLFTLILLTYTKDERGAAEKLFLESADSFTAAGSFRGPLMVILFAFIYKCSYEVKLHLKHYFKPVGGIHMDFFLSIFKGSSAKMRYSFQCPYFFAHYLQERWTKAGSAQTNWSCHQRCCTAHCTTFLPAQIDGFCVSTTCALCRPTSSRMKTVLLSSL